MLLIPLLLLIILLLLKSVGSSYHLFPYKCVLIYNIDECLHDAVDALV